VVEVVSGVDIEVVHTEVDGWAWVCHECGERRYAETEDTANLDARFHARECLAQ
jgi:hypothetical protein